MFKPKMFAVDVRRAGACAVVGLVQAHLEEATTSIGVRPTHLMASPRQLVNLEMLEQMGIEVVRRRGLGLFKAGEVRLVAEDEVV